MVSHPAGNGSRLPSGKGGGSRGGNRVFVREEGSGSRLVPSGVRCVWGGYGVAGERGKG